VEALTLPREDGCLEVACNLRSPLEADSASVLVRARQACESLGLSMLRSYSTGPSQQELELMLRQLTNQLTYGRTD